ncbi:shikimate kinase [Devosia riboflavina]|uniref:shikimate kinase n=1 Tax=Devosia riboflavina TaxID=46914 RepID=UPI0006913803|nr:shikimate kinase [Devosia riboflavina]
MATMDHPETHIEIRRPWKPQETLFLLGPGGVGKSTLGRELARILHWPLIDLDLEFCSRLDLIGRFISQHGYERYREANLALAKTLLSASTGPQIFVTASGFLAAPTGSPDNIEARRLVSTGYGIVLLPSRDIEIATPIVVERQLQRGFGLERTSEDQKFRHRFQILINEGDALVISLAQPAQIASALVQALSLPATT